MPLWSVAASGQKRTVILGVLGCTDPSNSAILVPPACASRQRKVISRRQLQFPRPIDIGIKSLFH